MSVKSLPLSPLPIDRRQFLIGGAGAAAGLLVPSPMLAQTKLQVTEGNVAPLPIAITNFVPGSPSDNDVGAGVTQVITNNLKRSGLFNPIDQAAFIERISNIDVAPQFQNWKTLNAQALVTGRSTALAARAAPDRARRARARAGLARVRLERRHARGFDARGCGVPPISAQR